MVSFRAKLFLSNREKNVNGASFSSAQEALAMSVKNSIVPNKSLSRYLTTLMFMFGIFSFCPLGCERSGCECLSDKFSDELTKEDIEKLDAEIDHCFPGEDRRLEKNAKCLPFDLGIDSRNQKTVTVQYGCWDLCPNYGFIYYYYKDVSEEDCCAEGGFPPDDPWAGYMGCMPLESDWAQFSLNNGPNPCE